METGKNKNLKGNSADENSVEGNSYATGAHLSPEAITAYQYGNFSSPEIEKQIQNHLLECRCCTNLLLELNEFTTETPDSISSQNTNVQWAKFEQKLAAQNRSFRQNLALEKQPETKNRFSWLSIFSLKPAAAFMVLAILIVGAISTVIFLKTRNAATDTASIIHDPPPTIGDSLPASNTNAATEQKIENNQKNDVYNQSYNQSGDRNLNPTNKNSESQTQKKLPQNKKIFKSTKVTGDSPKSVPGPKIPIVSENEIAQNLIDVSLYPTETLRGDAADKRIVRVNQNLVEQIRLKLNAPKSENISAYSIEIVNSQNKSVVTLPILPDQRGDFYLTVPLKKLPADVYSLKIYSEKDKVRSLFYDYEFELRYE